MGDAVTVFDIALTGDERAREIELHDKWLATLRADGSNPEIARLRFDRLHGNAVTIDDPARAWLTEAYACGAAYGDLNERAVRAAFEDENPSPLARAAFAQVYDQVRRGQDTSIAPLDRLRALPDQSVEDALAASETASMEREAARVDFAARLATAKAAAQSDVDAANAEVTTAAADVQKIKRGIARVTPSGAPATWSDAEQSRYDAHVEKLRAAEEREDAARVAAAGVDERIEESVDRSRLDAAAAVSSAASQRMLAAFEHQRARTRELAVYAAIPVGSVPAKTLAGSPFTTADLARLSAWGEQQIQERQWGQDSVVVETKKDVTLSLVRMRDGWGLVGVSSGVARQSEQAAEIRPTPAGL